MIPAEGNIYEISPQPYNCLLVWLEIQHCLKASYSLTRELVEDAHHFPVSTIF